MLWWTAFTSTVSCVLFGVHWLVDTQWTPYATVFIASHVDSLDDSGWWWVWAHHTSAQWCSTQAASASPNTDQGHIPCLFLCPRLQSCLLLAHLCTNGDSIWPCRSLVCSMWRPRSAEISDRTQQTVAPAILITNTDHLCWPFLCLQMTVPVLPINPSWQLVGQGSNLQPRSCQSDDLATHYPSTQPNFTFTCKFYIVSQKNSAPLRQVGINSVIIQIQKNPKYSFCREFHSE